jgi:ABC-type dipeptide/oligopeptide/nickel transport system permease component
VNARDYQVVQAVAFLGSAAFVFMNLMLDIAYAYIDPRVRYT